MVVVLEEIQVGLVNYIVIMDGVFFECCGLFMFLLGFELVQEVIIVGLFEWFDVIVLNVEILIFLLMIRGWFFKGFI